MIVGRFNANAKDSLIGRLMLRQVAAQCLGVQEPDWHRSPEGKPYLKTSAKVPNFNFNVSHDGNFIVLAADAGACIGVDVMEIVLRNSSETVAEFFELMESCFTINEWNVIRGGETDFEKLKQFYTHWTLKESYIKTIG